MTCQETREHHTDASLGCAFLLIVTGKLTLPLHFAICKMRISTCEFVSQIKVNNRKYWKIFYISNIYLNLEMPVAEKIFLSILSMLVVKLKLTIMLDLFSQNTIF